MIYSIITRSMKSQHISKKVKRKQSVPVGKKNLPYPPLPIVSIGIMKREILKLIFKGGNPHSIARKVGRARSTVLQHLKELQDMKLTKKGDYLWSISEYGRLFLEGRLDEVMYQANGVGTTGKWLQDRAHNIKIKFNITNPPTNKIWLHGWKKNDKLKNNVFYSKHFGEIFITYTGKSIIFQLPMLRFKSPEIAIAEAGRIGNEIARKYEREIDGLRLGEYEVKAQLITQHHAIEGDPFAKFCHKHGISFQGDIIEVDCSQTPEIEFTDAEKSHIHCQKYIDHHKDIILNDVPKLSEIMKIIDEQAKQNRETASGLNAVTKFLKMTPIVNIYSDSNPSYIG